MLSVVNTGSYLFKCREESRPTLEIRQLRCAGATALLTSVGGYSTEVNMDISQIVMHLCAQSSTRRRWPSFVGRFAAVVFGGQTRNAWERPLIGVCHASQLTNWFIDVIDFLARTGPLQIGRSSKS